MVVQSPRLMRAKDGRVSSGPLVKLTPCSAASLGGPLTESTTPGVAWNAVWRGADSVFKEEQYTSHGSNKLMRGEVEHTFIGKQI
eukprot:233615-Pelagomonas_calceolata.AAC.1